MARNSPFLKDFAELSRIGSTPAGGVERQAASAADCEARAWLEHLLGAMGATVIYDAIGNQFGLFEFQPGAPYVLVGSHLDSQPRAGRFDGAYGVLAAAHAAERLRAGCEENPPRRNLAVVNWFNEEGSRFTPSMMGSGVFCGTLPLVDALNATDLQGVSVREALDRAAWSGPAGSHTPPDICAYAEIHVEQGKTLEQVGAQIGVVTATWGARKYRAVVRGEQGHTGSTLMEDRRDALVGAAVVIAAVRRLCAEYPAGQLHSSVAQLSVQPNSPVTIAREVVFNVDLRSPHSEILAAAHERLHEITAEAAEESRTTITLEATHEWALNPYPEAGVQLGRAAAIACGYQPHDVYTVAGHDSTNLKEIVPTVMLFVPSVDGISHNEAECTSDADCLAGVEVLTAVVRRLLAGELG
ncbi:Putative hydrolase [Corynebacterium ciconiae DSM 44920]|uniref:M20 family metallo-hydrolase n=1 Tax=Corynebacterium ciconiae TaxID=227319 RepID=UPI000360CB34|nr:M20 family metallo-hydrolase [Corynebacterium ciconiae]WKD62209.1 Putative hydrolase [Corynebacterium ciconiae DSM 44920]